MHNLLQILNLRTHLVHFFSGFDQNLFAFTPYFLIITKESVFFNAFMIHICEDNRQKFVGNLKGQKAVDL